MTSWTHIKAGKTKIPNLLFLPHLELGSFFSVSCLYSSSSAWLGRTSHEGWLCYFLYRLWHLMKDMFLFAVTHTSLQGARWSFYMSILISYNLYFLKQIQAGVSALEEALQSGFEDFKVMNQWYRNTMLLRLYNLKVVWNFCYCGTENPNRSRPSQYKNIRGVRPSFEKVWWIIYQWKCHQCH